MPSCLSSFFCSNFLKTDVESESDMLEIEICNNTVEIINERKKKMMSGEEDSYGSTDFVGLLIKRIMMPILTRGFQRTK